MKLPCPPKRFEQVDDPRYDPIRPRKWFARLRKRREKLPALEQAITMWIERGCSHGEQKTVSEVFGLDEREFRDFVSFRSWQGIDPKTVTRDRAYQHILDGAYNLYCEHNAIRHISSFIEDVAPLYGIKARHVTEAWEIDPTFVPTNYL